MSHQFKVGDLAMITNHTFHEAIGRCVELVSRHLVGPVDRSDPMNPGVYESAAGEPAWVVTSEFFCEPGCIAWEKWLMPMRGDFVPEVTESREVAA